MDDCRKVWTARSSGHPFRASLIIYLPISLVGVSIIVPSGRGAKEMELYVDHVHQLRLGARVRPATDTRHLRPVSRLACIQRESENDQAAGGLTASPLSDGHGTHPDTRSRGLGTFGPEPPPIRCRLGTREQRQQLIPVGRLEHVMVDPRRAGLLSILRLAVARHRDEDRVAD